jgi:hypothetical protein
MYDYEPFVYCIVPMTDLEIGTLIHYMLRFSDWVISGGIRAVLGCRTQTIGRRKLLDINLSLRNPIRVVGP